VPTGSDAENQGNGSDLNERLNTKLRTLFIVLVLAWAIIGCFRPMMDNVDLGWHVAQGRWILKHAAFYRQDVLNYPNLGHSVIDEYPLFQVVLFLAWNFGWWGPCLLTASAYALFIGISVRTAQLFGLGASSLVATAIVVMLLYFQVAFPLRPHLISYLGIITFGTFLLRHRHAATWTDFWPMALLQIAWTNCHSGFVLGPAMVGLFGAEMVLRRWLRDRSLPWAMLRTWVGSFLLILLACFVNPYGWQRFYPPFYQNQLESIHAYVGEMEPLTGGLATLCDELTLVAVVVVVLAILCRRGAIAYSFFFFALLFYFEALTVKKAWPVFGSFVPLLVLSTGAFSSSPVSSKGLAWLSVFGHFAVSAFVVMGLYLEISPLWPTSLRARWQEYDRGRSELSIAAATWMKAQNVVGRLFHRSEDGGYLQQEGFDHSETFADTGFGKYDEAFIHEVGLVGERPALLPRYLHAYQPDFVVCSTFCQQWPYYLKQTGWRLIFYSPNSSVWTRPVVRTDLPTVQDEAVMTAFERDLNAYGRPLDLRLYGRNLIALNSLGLEDYTFAQMQSLPKELHHVPWYWEAARILCFEQPTFSPAHRIALLNEAEQSPDQTLTAEFRAYCHDESGDTDGALRILEASPPDHLGNNAAELLLKIYIDQKRPEALVLARRTDCFDLSNGHHWQYLAQAEEAAGHPDAAAHAWKEAVFYYPDDPVLLAGAAAFAVKFRDAALTQALADSAKVYGQP